MSEPEIDHQGLYSRRSIREHVDLVEVIDRVRDAFVAYEEGRAQMPAKHYLTFEEFNGDLRSMSAYVEEFNLATVKVVNSHSDNPKRHALPTVMALLVAVEPETGFPRAVMDATWLTVLRTAAVSAIATDLLAPLRVRRLGVLGTGGQAVAQVRSQIHVRPIEQIFLHDMDRDSARACRTRLREEFSRCTITVLDSAEEAVSRSEVVLSLTPARQPLVSPEVVPDRIHINAIGADAPGKQEWPESVLSDSGIVVDDWEQAAHSGEIQHLADAGEFENDDLLGTLGGIINDPPDTLPDRTVFDSTGLAIQDTAAAKAVLSGALKPDATFSFLG